MKIFSTMENQKETFEVNCMHERKNIIIRDLLKKILVLEVENEVVKVGKVRWCRWDRYLLL
jgi:hypothetical protein